MITPLVAALLSLGPTTQQPADSLPACDTWLANKVTGLSLSVDPRWLERLKSAGVSIEPSRRMRAEGYPWEHYLQIALPPSYGRTDRRYPVLWVTDGQFFFSALTAIATSCAGKTLPEMIVVAIGATPEADQTKNEIQSRRTFDFGPNTVKGFTGFGSTMHNERSEASDRKLKAEGKFTNERMGGAPRFLSFLVEDVRRRLAADYRMADDHTLLGHSGGGLFCTFALVARPSSFNRYVCGSPSLAAGDFEVFRLEERYAQQNKDLSAAVFFGAGEAEVLTGGSWGLVSSMARMAEILKLRGYPSLKLNARIFPGENHGSVIPLVAAWGLRAVWEKDFTPSPSGLN